MILHATALRLTMPGTSLANRPSRDAPAFRSVFSDLRAGLLSRVDRTNCFLRTAPLAGCDPAQSLSPHQEAQSRPRSIRGRSGHVDRLTFASALRNPSAADPSDWSSQITSVPHLRQPCCWSLDRQRAATTSSRPQFGQRGGPKTGVGVVTTGASLASTRGRVLIS
jgi:hypothetical protein